MSTWQVRWSKMTRNYIIVIYFLNITLKEKMTFKEQSQILQGEKDMYTRKGKDIESEKPLE